jgi:diguanylate cyclase (GGDEF)-like protein
MRPLQVVADAVGRAAPLAEVWPACARALQELAGSEICALVGSREVSHAPDGSHALVSETLARVRSTHATGAWVLGIPLAFAGKVHGVVLIGGPAAIDEECVATLEACALLLAARMDREDILADGERLAHLAFNDALTGISNRRAFDDALAREWRGAQRSGDTLSLLMLDVDYFKLYNDTYGHQRGDECLQRVAQAIRRALSRAGDFVARYGGEEFVALLPNTPPSAAAELAERVCDEIATLALEHTASSLRRVSVSVGIASCVPQQSALPESIIESADHELYRAKLSGRNRAAGAQYLSEAERALPVRKRSKSNLPIPLTPLIGRERELDALVNLAARGRLVTVVGVGGSGKTRLALEAADRIAERFADGAHFVDLAPLRDPATIVPAIANVLDIPIPGGGDGAGQLAEALADREMLVVLDNCEHLIDDIAPIVATVLTRAAKVPFLATSREPLALNGEILYDLPLLGVPPSDALSAAEALSYDSIRLFVERARAVRNDFALDELNAHHVASICRLLDGLPLAVELTAARVSAIPVDELARRIRTQMLPVAETNRNEPRQRTLDAAISWSYTLLTSAEQCILRRLAVFAGTLTSEAAGAVCSDDDHVPEEVANLLVRLARKSMTGVSSDGRYRLLEPIRQFCLIKLADAGELTQTAARHAAYYATAARKAREIERESSRTAWTFRVGADIDNYRTAITWALYGENDVDAGASIVGDIATVWEKFGIPEGQRDVRRALELTREHPYVWLAESWMLDYFGVLPRAQLETAQEAYQLFEARGDRAGLFDALIRRAQAHASLRDHDAASRDLDRASHIARELGKSVFEVHVARARARAALMREDWDEAGSLYSELIQHYRSEGNDHHAAVLLRSLAEIEFARGNVERAIECTYEPEALSLDISQRMVMDTNLTCYLVAAGRFTEAREVGSKVIAQTWQRQLRVGRVLTIQHLALAAVLEGDAERAARLCGFVDAAVTELEFVREFTERYTYERLLNLLYDRLAQRKLERLRAVGADMTDERAAQEATAAA